MSNKLTSLRAAMAGAKIDAYFVPMEDEFQSEMVPEHSQRLKWLTGFSGSAGYAIITAKKSAFFTDGRYTIQAKNEVSQSDFECLNISEKSGTGWLQENLAKGKIGYDAWLLTQGKLRNLEAVCGDDIDWVSLPNLIDDLWHTRPEENIKPAFIYNIKYAGEDFEKKLENRSNKLKGNSCDKLVLTLPESICWLLNIRGNDLPCTPFLLCYAILNASGDLQLFTNLKKLNDVFKKHFSGKVTFHQLEDFEGELHKISDKKIWLDLKNSPAKIHQILQKNNNEILDKEDPCLLPKACKNKTEIQGMKNAHIRDGAALCEFLFWLKNNAGCAGITEFTIAEELKKFRIKRDLFHSLSFETIAGYQKNGAIVHYRADEETAKELQEKGILLLDSGGQYMDGTTDITRTVAVGDDITEEQKYNFTLVLKGHIALARAKFPSGTTGSHLDVLARQHLWQESLDYEHGTGHGVGAFMNVHEGPQGISKRANDMPLQEGMVISNEPGFYLEGEYGIRIESLVVVKKLAEKQGRSFLGFETISLAPIDRNLIAAEMLNDDEREWLNNYHKKVLVKLAPIVPNEVAKWLTEACAEI